MSDPSGDILTIEQIISIIGKINSNIASANILSQFYASVTVYPEIYDTNTFYIEVAFPYENVIWDSENYEHTEEAIKDAIYHELKIITDDSKLIAKHLNLCD